MRALRYFIILWSLIGKQLVQTQSFSHNMFTGPLPPSILKQYVIFQLYVDNNLLSGTLPVVESK